MRRTTHKTSRFDDVIRKIAKIWRAQKAPPQFPSRQKLGGQAKDVRNERVNGEGTSGG